MAKCPFMSKLITSSKNNNGYSILETTTNDGLIDCDTTFNTEDPSLETTDPIDIYDLRNSQNDIIEGGYFLYHECIEEKCQLWDSINERCGFKTSDVIIHKHESHYHMLPHECPDLDVGCGYTSSGSNRAIILISEFHGNEDLDNNGLIYGKDFKIEDNEEKPPVLKSIENSPSWVEPKETMTWPEYKG